MIAAQYTSASLYSILTNQIKFPLPPTEVLKNFLTHPFSCRFVNYPWHFNKHQALKGLHFLLWCGWPGLLQCWSCVTCWFYYLWQKPWWSCILCTPQITDNSLYMPLSIRWCTLVTVSAPHKMLLSHANFVFKMFSWWHFEAILLATNRSSSVHVHIVCQCFD